MDIETNAILSSKLELVDLAGSERISSTGTEGKLAKESIDINKSLFTLRQVINALSDLYKNPKNKDQTHIPYRDSKLTSLLKQSIGGNSYCLMIACITPADQFLEENISTLNYATKATYIQCEPVKNDDPKNILIKELKAEVAKLKQELSQANQHIQFLTSLTNKQITSAASPPQGSSQQLSANDSTIQIQQPGEQQYLMANGAQGKSMKVYGSQLPASLQQQQQFQQQPAPALQGGASNEQEQDQSTQFTNTNHIRSSFDYGSDNTEFQKLQLPLFYQTQTDTMKNFKQKTLAKNNSRQMNQSVVDYDHFSDRLIESIAMVRELLQGNKQLRE